MPLDNLGKTTHDDLQQLALEHPSFESFLQEVQRLAEKLWHNARSQAEAQAEADLEQQAIAARTAAGNDPSAAPPLQSPAVGEEGNDGAPVDEGQPITQPAEPASPVSDGGFPTTNVGVVVSENPDDGTQVPVEESHPA